MSHEMTRAEAREAGFDVDANVTVTIASVDDRESDVVDVWAQLPDATDVESRPLSDNDRAEVYTDTVNG